MATPVNSEFGGNEFGAYQYAQGAVALLDSSQSVGVTISADLSVFVEFEVALTGGNMMSFGTLTTSQDINSGQQAPKFATGSLIVTYA